MKIKHIIMAGLAFCGSLEMKAESEFEGTVEADVVSQYIWRGQNLGDAAIQPTLGVDWKGLSLSAWGNVGITNFNDTKEMDLDLGYSKGGFSVGVTDYWFNEGAEPAGRYFKYKNDATNHVFEGRVGYDFGPVSLTWFTNFAGNDGVNKNGKRAYSSYFEISAPFKFVKCDWEATLGAVPYATSFYDANGFCITNISLKATKELSIGDKIDLPIFAGLTANPRAEKMYLTFGFAIKPKL